MTEVIPTFRNERFRSFGSTRADGHEREDSSSISDINGKKIKLQEKLLQVRLASKIGSGKETFLRAVCGAFMKTCKL